MRGRRRSAPRPRRLRQRRRATASSPPSEPTECGRSASATRRIVGASAVMATRASVTRSTVHGHRPRSRRRPRSPSAVGIPGGRRPSRCPARAPAGRPRRGARRDRASSCPGRSTVRRRATERSPDRTAASRSAPRHSSGPPVSIAGDAFITLPPIVPLARVACEPTIADASARAVNRTHGSGRSRRCPRGSRARPSRRPPSVEVDRTSASIRSIATIASGSGALPCRAPTTRSVPPATGRAPATERGDRFVDR